MFSISQIREMSQLSENLLKEFAACYEYYEKSKKRFSDFEFKYRDVIFVTISGNNSFKIEYNHDWFNIDDCEWRTEHKRTYKGDIKKVRELLDEYCINDSFDIVEYI